MSWLAGLFANAFFRAIGEFFLGLLNQARRDRDQRDLGRAEAMADQAEARGAKRREADDVWDMLDRDRDPGDLRGDL